MGAALIRSESTTGTARRPRTTPGMKTIDLIRAFIRADEGHSKKKKEKPFDDPRVRARDFASGVSTGTRSSSCRSRM